METCSVVLIFDSVYPVVWPFKHSNETSSVVLLHGTILKFGDFLECLCLSLLELKV